MLVYSNYFILNPEEGLEKIYFLLVKWLKNRSRGKVSPEDIKAGKRQRLKDGSVVDSKASSDTANEISYPFLQCIRLSHDDDSVRGRRWFTEIGILKDSESSQIECSILLRTEDISGLVTQSLQVSRPNIVKELISSGNPVSHVPGQKIKTLDSGSAQAYLWEVERLDRYYPLVVISHMRSGHCHVDLEKLRSLLVGLADIIVVPADQDSFEFERQVGKGYAAWGGGFNIIHRARRHKEKIICDSSIHTSKRVQGLVDAGINIEPYILAAVTHRTNSENYRRHISMERVSQAALHAKLRSAIAVSHKSDELAEYVELLEEADSLLYKSAQKNKDLEGKLQAKEEEISLLNSQIDGLKHALDGQQQSSQQIDEDALDVLENFRTLLMPVIGSDKPKPSLEECMNIIQALFRERVVFLDTAFDSARESSDFIYGMKAFSLMWRLVNSYWEDLRSGKGEQIAMKCFGRNEYAQNEANALSVEGRRRRTFVFEGQEFLMDKHLKIGVKDSLTETLRIHFMWLNDRKQVIVGHCGKHINF